MRYQMSSNFLLSTRLALQARNAPINPTQPNRMGTLNLVSLVEQHAIWPTEFCWIQHRLLICWRAYTDSVEVWRGRLQEELQTRVQQLDRELAEAVLERDSERSARQSVEKDKQVGRAILSLFFFFFFFVRRPHVPPPFGVWVTICLTGFELGGPLVSVQTADHAACKEVQGTNVYRV